MQRLRASRARRASAAGDRLPHSTFKESETAPRASTPRRAIGRPRSASLFTFKENPRAFAYRKQARRGSRFSLVIDTTGDAGVISALPDAGRERRRGPSLRGDARRGARVFRRARAPLPRGVGRRARSTTRPGTRTKPSPSFAGRGPGRGDRLGASPARRLARGIRSGPGRGRDEGRLSFHEGGARTLARRHLHRGDGGRPAGPGEIVVAMKAVGICGSDTTPWYVATKAPVVLGHEPAGVVAEVGDRRHRIRRRRPRRRPSSRRLRRLSALPRRRRRHVPGVEEDAPPPGRPRRARARRGRRGRHGHTSTAGLPFLRGRRARRTARVRREGGPQGARRGRDTVAVIGLGANGILLGLVAKSAGAATLVGCDPDPARREHSLRLGFDQVLAPEEDVAEKVKRGDRGYRRGLRAADCRVGRPSALPRPAPPAASSSIHPSRPARHGRSSHICPTCVTFPCSSVIRAARVTCARLSR